MIIFPTIFCHTFFCKRSTPSRKTSKTVQEDIIFPSKSLGILCFFRTFVLVRA